MTPNSELTIGLEVKFISSNRNAQVGNSDTTMQASMSTVPI